jgi:hypothetical protein
MVDWKSKMDMATAKAEQVNESKTMGKLWKVMDKVSSSCSDEQNDHTWLKSIAAMLIYEKVGAKTNEVAGKMGVEAFYPQDLGRECEKAARILRVFTGQSRHGDLIFLVGVTLPSDSNKLPDWRLPEEGVPISEDEEAVAAEPHPPSAYGDINAHRKKQKVIRKVSRGVGCPLSANYWLPAEWSLGHRAGAGYRHIYYVQDGLRMGWCWRKWSSSKAATWWMW